MVRCTTCGHLKSLHGVRECKVVARDSTSRRWTYKCTCNHFYPEPPLPKKVWSKKEIVAAIIKCQYKGILYSDDLEKILFKEAK